MIIADLRHSREILLYLFYSQLLFIVSSTFRESFVARNIAKYFEIHKL